MVGRLSCGHPSGRQATSNDRLLLSTYGVRNPLLCPWLGSINRVRDFDTPRTLLAYRVIAPMSSYRLGRTESLSLLYYKRSSWSLHFGSSDLCSSTNYHSQTLSPRTHSIIPDRPGRVHHHWCKLCSQYFNTNDFVSAQGV